MPERVQLVSVTWHGPPLVPTPPPEMPAELPLSVQPVSVVVPRLNTPPPKRKAELPLMVQFVSVTLLLYYSGNKEGQAALL